MLASTAAYADTASTVKAKEYELWTQSPSITSGLTSNDIKIYKSIDQGVLKLLPLSKVGPNYYLAICENKVSNGGYSGKTQTTYFTFYTLYATEDASFIVLSSQTPYNEYYWDRGFSMVDISDKLDSAYYTDKGYELPCYIINPSGKYTNSNYEEYDDYFFISSSGKLYKMSENAENGTEGYPYIKDKILYRGQERYRQNSSSYPFYYMADGYTKASSSKPMHFKNGSTSYGTEVKVSVANMIAANGYVMYKEGFSSNISFPTYYPIPDSDRLFFSMSTTKTLDSTDNTEYYYLNLSIYESKAGAMKCIKKVTVPTKNTSSSFTPQKIVGIDADYYIGNGLPIPSITFGHHVVLARDGTVCGLQLDKSKYASYCYPCTYNGRYSIIRSYNGSNYIYKQDPADGVSYYWQVINEITIDANGNKSIGADIELKIQDSAHEGQNGFFTSYNKFNSPNFTSVSTSGIKDWWGKSLTKYFPDGRYVAASWTSMGSGLYELWYNIYNKDGTLRATGPSGYSGYFSSASSTYKLIAWAINDSKFIVCLGDINNSFLKEYYRVAVVEESNTGEVVSKVEVGEKNIIPPNDSDTEVVQSKIDFGVADLPLGYNIKDNVIDSGKLDALLRDQVNSVRLNDIVILAKDGYQSGEQNTGTTLNTYSEYDYSLGSSYVRLYTNGQYFRWYCNNPEELSPGTYSKTITIGDKTIYVTFKVVQPPTNEGSTMVVF